MQNFSKIGPVVCLGEMERKTNTVQSLYSKKGTFIPNLMKIGQSLVVTALYTNIYKDQMPNIRSY